MKKIILSVWRELFLVKPLDEEPLTFEAVLEKIADKGNLMRRAIKKVGSLSPYLFSYLNFCNKNAIAELENAKVKSKVWLTHLYVI